MRRPLSEYDFVDFVTFTLAAMAFVIALYMETGLI